MKTLTLLSLLVAVLPAAVARSSSSQEKIAPKAPKVTTLLMFTGQAEEAMKLYVSLFEGSKVLEVQRHGPNGSGKEGEILHATFSLAGTLYRCFDSLPVHPFTFTPSMSIFVECESEAELDHAFKTLSEGGEVMMPPDDYGFSRKFTWVADRFGVSWQLNLVE